MPKKYHQKPKEQWPEGLIESLTCPKGEGVLRDPEAEIVLVKGALPGQQIRYIAKRRKGILRAVEWELLEDGPDLLPPQEHHSGITGSAPWQRVSSELQRETKREWVLRLMSQYPDMDLPDDFRVRACEPFFRYRNAVELSYGCEIRRTTTLPSGEKIQRDENPSLGFHRSGDWREVVQISESCLMFPMMEKLLPVLHGIALDSGEPFWNPLRSQGFWREVRLQGSQRTQQMVLSWTVSEERDASFWKPLIQALREASPELKGVCVRVYDGPSVPDQNTPIETLWGEPWYDEVLCDTRLEIPVGAFFQVHTPGIEQMLMSLHEQWKLDGESRILDLYSGVGTLGIPLASMSGAQVYGRELHKGAVESAMRSVQDNQVRGNYTAGRVEDDLSLSEYEATHLLIDPPRAGMSPQMMKSVLDLEVPHLALVSCHPATLMRDLDRLQQEGNYRIISMEGFDFFPQTPHLEVLTVLTNGSEDQ